MAKFPHLPLFTDAYIADTVHLSHEEHGLYLMLLMTVWRSPECKIPNDMEWIKRRLRASDEQMEKYVKNILDEVFSSTGNYIFQKRLRDEFEYVKTKSKKCSASAKSRFLKEKHISERNAPIPIPIPIDTNVSNINPQKAKKEDKFEQWWKQYPRRVGKGDSRREFARAIKKIGFEELMSATLKYSMSVQKMDQGFIPYPQRWLKNERWSDEHESIASERKSAKSSGGEESGSIVAAAQRFVSSREP